MTRSKIEKIIKRNSSGEKRTISTEEGLQAAQAVIEIAEQNAVEWAFAGGIAMHLYGFFRATTDVDVVASKALPIQSQRTLGIGGESYPVKVGTQTISVDWIVRNDENKDFYEAAIPDAIELENGLRVITPEWLIIFKFLAGRPKDQLDLIWLLQQDDLVNRELVTKLVTNILGKRAAYFVLRELQSEFDYADVLKMREVSDLE